MTWSTKCQPLPRVFREKEKKFMSNLKIAFRRERAVNPRDADIVSVQSVTVVTVRSTKADSSVTMLLDFY